MALAVLPHKYGSATQCFRMVAMLIRVEYLGHLAAFGTLEAKRADKLTATIIGM